MSQELTINASMVYADSENTSESFSIEDFIGNVTTKRYVKAKVSVGTSEEAIPLGEVTTLGWACFRNRDATNYVEIRSATGSANDIIKIPPGGVALFHFGSDVTAPYWIANTAACQCEYFIVNT